MESQKDDMNAEDLQKSRKRKFDIDGFVCPTTPDIPRSSHQNVENRNHGQLQGVDCVTRFPNMGGDFSQTNAVSVSGYFSPLALVEKRGDNVNYNTDEKFEQFRQQAANRFFNNVEDNLSFQNETMHQTKIDDSSDGPRDISLFQTRETFVEEGDETPAKPYDTDYLPNEEGAATQEGPESLLQSLFRGFEQESSTFYENWNKIFRQCGQYETMCQQRLGGLMHGARSIQHGLNTKKDILCNRLQGIGKTLET